MSSVGFTSQLPSVTDFLANQGAFIDTQILMVVIGSAQADAISKSVAAQAERLAGQMARAGALVDTLNAMGQMVDKIVKPEINEINAKTNDWTNRQSQNPVPSIGKTPDLANWQLGGQLTYYDDADAQWLKDRDLPVAVYVPAQSKTFQVVNPEKAIKAAARDAAWQTYLDTPANPPGPKQAAYDNYVAKYNEWAATPPYNYITQTAPQIGTPDAYNQNKATIAAYKAQLENGTADNKYINGKVANDPELAALRNDLASQGVSTPTKLKEIPAAVGELALLDQQLDDSINQLRSELLALVDKAGAATEFLNQLAQDLGKEGQKQIDKLQRKVADLDALDLSPLEPQIRAVVEDVLIKLDALKPPGDSRELLEKLPLDQQREALKQISSYQQELEALQGTNAPATSSPSFQLSSRLTRV